MITTGAKTFLFLAHKYGEDKIKCVNNSYQLTVVNTISEEEIQDLSRYNLVIKNMYFNSNRCTIYFY